MAWLRSTFTVLGGVLIVAATSTESAPRQALKDVVDTAIGAGSFKTLVSAIQAAGLVTQLKGAGPYTVLAPTDDAFAKIPKADLDALVKDKPKLTKVLTHHVFAGNANSSDLAMLKDLSVASGGRLPIVVLGKGKFTIGGANVLKPDVAASNGIIHVIDTVLMPK
jgi:uncharacterized surface protein with fasciclin (FAS1) repeats